MCDNTEWGFFAVRKHFLWDSGRFRMPTDFFLLLYNIPISLLCCYVQRYESSVFHIHEQQRYGILMCRAIQKWFSIWTLTAFLCKRPEMRNPLESDGEKQKKKVFSLSRFALMMAMWQLKDIFNSISNPRLKARRSFVLTWCEISFSLQPDCSDISKECSHKFHPLSLSAEPLCEFKANAY